MKQILVFFLLAAALLTTGAFRSTPSADTLTGAWRLQESGGEQVIQFMDGYFTHTTFDKARKWFVQTRGGTYIGEKNKLTVHYEFDTGDSTQIGKTITYNASVASGQLRTDVSGTEQGWSRLDAGDGPLAGLWAITARKQDGALQPIHQRGTRKTVKVLTGTRFQWAAIDPGTRQFLGTGGGTYTFKDGKYTEHIEFFSRDSSRVGSSLSFDGRLEKGDWHHSGLSSRGDPIYEVWSRKN